MCWTDFVSLSKKWRTRGRWSTLARVVSARCTQGRSKNVINPRHGCTVQCFGAWVWSRVSLWGICAPICIFLVCTAGVQFWAVFTSLRRPGGAEKVVPWSLGGRAHFYCMHGWVGWVWDGYASPQGHENRASKLALVERAQMICAQVAFDSLAFLATA